MASSLAARMKRVYERAQEVVAADVSYVSERIKMNGTRRKQDVFLHMLNQFEREFLVKLKEAFKDIDQEVERELKSAQAEAAKVQHETQEASEAARQTLECPFFRTVADVPSVTAFLAQHIPQEQEEVVPGSPEGSTDSVSSVPGSPISGSPISGSPISGSPISGSPISGSPISGSPISGSPDDSLTTQESPSTNPPVSNKRERLSSDDSPAEEDNESLFVRQTNVGSGSSSPVRNKKARLSSNNTDREESQTPASSATLGRSQQQNHRTPKPSGRPRIPKNPSAHSSSSVSGASPQQRLNMPKLNHGTRVESAAVPSDTRASRRTTAAGKNYSDADYFRERGLRGN